MRTEELIGAALNYWVGKAQGWDVTTDGYACQANPQHDTNGFLQSEDWFVYEPASSWSEGGRIIEREHITIGWHEGKFYKEGAWIASLPNHDEDLLASGVKRCGYQEIITAQGKTALEAAMRCYVKSKFGATVGCIA